MSPSPSAQRPTAIPVLPLAHVETELRKRDGLGTIQESPQQHQLLIFRFLGHDVNPLNLSADTTKSPPCLTDDEYGPKNKAKLETPTK